MATPIIDSVSIEYPEGVTSLGPEDTARISVLAHDPDGQTVTVTVTVEDEDGNSGTTSSPVDILVPVTYAATAPTGTVEAAGELGQFDYTAPISGTGGTVNVHITATSQSEAVSVDVPVAVDGTDTVLFADDFNRADSAAAIGGTWSASAGTWGILENKAYCATKVANNYSRATHPGVAADGSVLADITLSPTANRACAGLIARWGDSTHFVAVFLYKTATSNMVNVQEANGGALSILASSAMTFVNGQTYAMRVVLHGTDLKVYIDSVLAVSATVSAASSAHSGVGFILYSQSSGYEDGGSRWENLQLTDGVA